MGHKEMEEKRRVKKSGGGTNSKLIGVPGRRGSRGEAILDKGGET